MSVGGGPKGQLRKNANVTTFSENLIYSEHNGTKILQKFEKLTGGGHFTFSKFSEKC